MMVVKPSERGAALLTVLILVGVMGALSVAMFDRLRMATLLSGNARDVDEARAFGLFGEALVTTRIDDLVVGARGKTTLAGDWLGRPITVPLPNGSAVARVSDGGNCFNLNSLVTGMAPDAFVSNPVAIAQFTALMTLLGIVPGEARRISASAADWIDSDTVPNRDGAEDAHYGRATRPYRTANTLMADASELRAVGGVGPRTYGTLRRWLCVLPLARMSPINVNTLTPEQAPLLAMLLGHVAPIETARRVIAERPAAGWPRPAAFWATPLLRNTADSYLAAVAQQVEVQTRWFAIDLRGNAGGDEWHQTALVDAQMLPSRVVARRWTGDE